MPTDNPLITEKLSPEQVKALTQQITNMPMMYFNYVRVASSFFDVRLYFGQGNVSPTGQHQFQEELCVAVSVEFAKVLRDSLNGQIEAYEKNFGILRNPPIIPEITRIPSEDKKERKKHS